MEEGREEFCISQVDIKAEIIFKADFRASLAALFLFNQGWQIVANNLHDAGRQRTIGVVTLYLCSE